MDIFIHNMQPRASFLNLNLNLNYPREELLALLTKGRAGIQHPIPAELRRRPRGCKAGAKLKVKLTKNWSTASLRFPRLSWGMWTRCWIRSTSCQLNNQRTYQENSLFIFMETWLNHLVWDAYMDLPGFTAVRADRDTKTSGKCKGRGLIMYVNNRWCNLGQISP